MNSNNEEDVDSEKILKKLFSDSEDEIFEALDELPLDPTEWEVHVPASTTIVALLIQDIESTSSLISTISTNDRLLLDEEEDQGYMKEKLRKSWSALSALT